MKILYVLKQYYDPWWKEFLKQVRDWYYFNYMEGFFRASLYRVHQVKEVRLSWLLKRDPESLQGYDCLATNYLCNRYKGDFENRRDFKTFREILPDLVPYFSYVPGAVLIANASPGKIARDEVLDHFQLVFKREPYKDRSRYSLSPDNQNKICPTTLSSPLISANKLNYRRVSADNVGFSEPPDQFENDVFFLGKATSSIRERVIEKLLNTNYDFLGGLQSVAEPISSELQFPRMDQNEYHQQIWKSKINLALPGWGDFTYRHWEIWGLSSFMLTTSTINQLELPFSAEEGKHYATFEDMQNLIEKIDYYLRNSSERRKIARSGRELFENEYDFQKHGQFLTENMCQKMDL